MTDKDNILLGVHVSIAGHISLAVDRAKKLKINTMQIFARSPRQWRHSHLTEEDVTLFKNKIKETKISPVVVHIPYTLNLATAKDKFHKITIDEFIEDLKEADLLGADYLITHMGSYKGTTKEEGLSRIINALDIILDKTKDGKTKVLLENTAGSGSWLGASFSDHRFILEKLNWTKRVGVCLDTAHAWAAGFKINGPEGVEELIAHIDKEVGLCRLGVIHLNDTEVELGSKHDRHCEIGKGKIGKKGFKALMSYPKIRKLPFILETPKEEDEDDLNNLKVVRRLYKDAVLKGS